MTEQEFLSNAGYLLVACTGAFGFGVFIAIETIGSVSADTRIRVEDTR